MDGIITKNDTYYMCKRVNHHPIFNISMYICLYVRNDHPIMGNGNILISGIVWYVHIDDIPILSRCEYYICYVPTYV